MLKNNSDVNSPIFSLLLLLNMADILTLLVLNSDFLYCALIGFLIFRQLILLRKIGILVILFVRLM